MADKVALCCMAALCKVFKPYTQQSCLNFPAERQLTRPHMGVVGGAFGQTEEKYVVTKSEDRLYSVFWNWLKKKNLK